MSNFKPGDRVIRVAPSHNGVVINCIYTVDTCVNNNLTIVGGSHYTYAANGFEPYTKIDLRNDRWFIRTPDMAKCELIQEWLFSKGLKWRIGGDTIDYDRWPIITNGREPSKFLMWDDITNIENYLLEGVQEITFDFKMVIDQAYVPDALTAEDLEIISLDKQIKEMQNKLDVLKRNKARV